MLRFWHRNVFIIWQFLRNIMCNFLKQIYRSKNQYFLLILITHDQENNILIGSHDVLAQNHVRKITLDLSRKSSRPTGRHEEEGNVARDAFVDFAYRTQSRFIYEISKKQRLSGNDSINITERLMKWREKNNIKNKKRRILTKRSRTKTEWTKQGEDRVNKKCVTSRKTGN